MRSWFIPLAVCLLLLIPTVAEAHGANGSGGWGDEIVFLVAGAILLTLAFALGRGGKREADEEEKK